MAPTAPQTLPEEAFDRVIVGRGVPFEPEQVEWAATKLGTRSGPGVLVHLPEDQASAVAFKHAVEQGYTRSRFWECESTQGLIQMAEVQGRAHAQQ